MTDQRKQLTGAEKALALQMFSVQHLKQADIAAHFGVSQSAISYLTRRALGAQTGQRVPRIDPSLPATMLREAVVQLENHITDLEKLLGRARSTLAMLRQAPEPTSRPVDATKQLAYLLQHPSEELGPLWTGADDPIMFHGEGLPQEVQDRAYPSGGIPVPVWAEAFPYTFVLTPSNESWQTAPSQIVTVEDALSEYLEYLESLEGSGGFPVPPELMGQVVRAEKAEQVVYVQKYSPPFDDKVRALEFIDYLERVAGIVGGLGTDGDKFVVQWTEPA